MLYYTTPGHIPQVVFSLLAGRKKIFLFDRILQKFRPAFAILTTENDSPPHLLPNSDGCRPSLSKRKGPSVFNPVCAKEEVPMNYQREYALLVGQVDRVISILEQFPAGDPIVAGAAQLLIAALQQAEDHYVSLAE